MGYKVKKCSRLVLIVIIAFINVSIVFTYISYADQNVVEYGNDKNYAPFSYESNDKPTGFENDLINLIFSNGEYVLKFNMDYTWAKVEELTKNKKLDICGPLVKTPEREKEMLISDVAYSRYYGVFTKADSGELIPSDLGAYKIGAVKGYYGEIIAKDILKATDVVIFENFSEMLHALAGNQIFAVADSIETIKYYIEKENLSEQIILQKDGMFSYDASFGISKDRPDLLIFVNQRLKEIIASGEYEILYIKNFSTHSKYYNDSKNQTYIISILGIIGITILILILIRLYIIYLKKRIFSDLEKINEKDKELLFLSRYDHLTGVYGRRFYEEDIERIDIKENLPLSFIMGDVNGLKLINDSFGHKVGDEILIKSANAIKLACRERDIVARLGGDEFIIALPNSNTEDALKVIDHIKNLLKHEKVSGLEISISFGYETKIDEKQDIKDIYINIENQMYQRKIYESASIRSKTITLITSALFEKNNRELIHSKKVSELCILVSEKMGFSKENINLMRLAGLMHDIGKIGISDKILNKTGKLNENEYFEIKKHPEIGYRILSSIIEFSEIANFVLEHHEKWDGTGYPQGLKGEEIRIEARIIAIADAYDAMTTKRTYRDALSDEDAIDEIRRCAGTQFDPNIVSIFVKHIMNELI